MKQERPSQDCHQLSYFRPPASLGRYMLQTFVVACAMWVGILGCYHWCSVIWRGLVIHHWTSLCLKYAPSPNHLVYEEDGSCANVHDNIAHGTFHSQIPNCWIGFRSARGLIAITDPSRQNGTLPAPPIFLHGLKDDASGPDRVFYVTAHGWECPKVYLFNYACYYSPRHSYYSDSDSDRTLAGVATLTTSDCRSGGCCLFAGIPDPLDPSHFTIKYSSRGLVGTIDGWLKSTNDGDDLVLNVRDGPLKP